MPTDKTKSAVTYDYMVELYNQLHLHGQEQFKEEFWGHPDLPPIIAAQLEEVAESRIKCYTPQAKSQQEDLDVAGIIEKFNPKKKQGESQI
jgi:hypothetical protein